MTLASTTNYQGNLSLVKLYAKQGDQFRPSAWWAVKEVPGIVLCYIKAPAGSMSSNGWAAILVAERLGVELPWVGAEIASVAKWFTSPIPLPKECPAKTRATLYALNDLGSQVFPTRRSALQSLEVALLIAASIKT